MDEPLYRMTPLEIAWGYLMGLVPEGPDQPRPAGARAELERVIGDALRRPPCGIAFSGGRDSSTVLAVAVHVARRDGLPDPVPITRVFPDDPRSEETHWQELVIDHLGIREWERISLGDELDIVGPVAARNLLQHGVLWPPTLASDVPLLERLPGGTLLDGEGGDDVFGVGSHRIAPLAALVRAPTSATPRRVRAAAKALAPSPVRRRIARRRLESTPLTWLRPAAADPLRAAIEEHEATRPLSFAASVRCVGRRRTQLLGRQNRRVLAAPYGVDVVSPLIEPAVVEALALEGGWLGQGDRTAVLRGLVADLLPDEILARTSKAAFTGSYMGRQSAAFVASWDGTGLDPELVDVGELQRIWREERLLAPTAALLQQAWLASGTGR